MIEPSLDGVSQTFEVEVNQWLPTVFIAITANGKLPKALKRSEIGAR